MKKIIGVLLFSLLLTSLFNGAAFSENRDIKRMSKDELKQEHKKLQEQLNNQRSNRNDNQYEVSTDLKMPVRQINDDNSDEKMRKTRARQKELYNEYRRR